MPSTITTISSSCRRCEYICGSGDYECSDVTSLCEWSMAILFAIYFSYFVFLGANLFVELHFKRNNFNKLKVLVYSLWSVTFFCRWLRYIIIVTQGSEQSDSTLHFTNVLYWISLETAFLSLCSMMLCWSEICSSSTDRRNWMNWKYFGITCGAVTILCIGSISSLSVFPKQNMDSYFFLFNSLFALITLALCCVCLYYCRQVLKLKEDMKIKSTKKSLRALTKHMALSAIWQIVLFIVLIIASIIYLSYPNSIIYCQVRHLIYRALEITLCTIMVWPLRSRIRRKQPDDSTSTGFKSTYISRIESTNSTAEGIALGTVGTSGSSSPAQTNMSSDMADIKLYPASNEIVLD